MLKSLALIVPSSLLCYEFLKKRGNRRYESRNVNKLSIPIFRGISKHALCEVVDDAVIKDVAEPRINPIVKVSSKVVPAVVKIITKYSMFDYNQNIGSGNTGFKNSYDNNEYSILGSGFFIDKSGIIITNAHVIENAKTLQVETTNGSRYVVNVIAMDLERDLCLLAVWNSHDEEFDYLEFSDSDNVQVGEGVIAASHPFHLNTCVSAGIVSGFLTDRLPTGSHQEIKFIQTDATITMGNSGGPLVNMNGQVIGINTVAMFSAFGFSFAIPSKLAKKWVSDVEKNPNKYPKSITRPGNKPRFGIDCMPLTNTTLNELRSAHPDSLKDITIALLVETVTPDSHASFYGVKHGDILLKVNRKWFHDINEFKEGFSQEVGELEILRGDKVITLKSP